VRRRPAARLAAFLSGHGVRRRARPCATATGNARTAVAGGGLALQRGCRSPHTSGGTDTRTQTRTRTRTRTNVVTDTDTDTGTHTRTHRHRHKHRHKHRHRHRHRHTHTHTHTRAQTLAGPGAQGCVPFAMFRWQCRARPHAEAEGHMTSRLPAGRRARRKGAEAAEGARGRRPKGRTTCIAVARRAMTATVSANSHI
jgi:hypothetical protein